MVNIRFLLFALIILTQCGWASSGWQEIISPTAFYSPGSPQTTNQTLSSAQTGNVIVYNGTATNTSFFLPSATVGLNYTIVLDVAKQIRIVPVAADIINFSTLTAGQAIGNTSAAKGNNITLVCQTAGQWSIASLNGTWALTP